jgi:competence protein ComEC
MALRRSREGFAVDAVKPRGIDRPWSPAIGGDGEAETTILEPRRQVAPRAIDATPSEADLQAEE